MKKILSTRTFILSLLVMGMHASAWAGSKLVSVQGRITDASGNPLNGPSTVTFRLYTQQSEPIANALWTETQGLTVQNGLINAALGSVNSLDNLPFNMPYYLGMQVSGDPNELSPRQLLGASAYSLGSLGNFNVQGNLTSSGTFTSKGITGTTSGDNAAQGVVGEYVEATTGTVASTGNGYYTDLLSIYLTPGDWDVTGIAVFDGNGQPWTQFILGVGTHPNNDPAGLTVGQNEAVATLLSPANPVGNVTLVVPSVRFSLDGPGLIYLKRAFWAPMGNPGNLGARLSARRVR